MRRAILLVALAGICLTSLLACGPPSGSLPGGHLPSSLVGDWRVYSARMFYDAGGGGSVSQSGDGLTLSNDGTWHYGSSQGAARVAEITDADWQRWGIASYGPTQRLVLQSWSGSQADGPIESEGNRVDFVWVIYHVSTPDPGTVWLKFGH